MFSLESPHRGDSNEYTKVTIFNIKKKITQNYPKSAEKGFFSKGHKNEFETAVVNEPSVCEPLNFYCNSYLTVRTVQLQNKKRVCRDAGCDLILTWCPFTVWNNLYVIYKTLRLKMYSINEELRRVLGLHCLQKR